MWGRLVIRKANHGVYGNKKKRKRKQLRKRSVQSSSTGGMLLRWIVGFLWTSGALATLRGGDAASLSSVIVCRITIEDTIYTKGSVEQYTVEQLVCIPVETEDLETYVIQLPDWIATKYRAQIKSGRLHIKLTGASLYGDSVKTTKFTSFSVIEGYDEARHLTANEAAKGAFGQRTYALVRISTTDSSPMYTMDHMVKRFVDDTIGMEAQYRDCSKNQLHFELASAYDVELPFDISHYQSNPRILRDAAVQQIKDEYSINNFPAGVADHGKSFIRHCCILYLSSAPST